MKTKFHLFEKDDDPFYTHELRMKKGYRPKYRSGLIAIRFIDDEVPFGKKYQEEEEGGFKINYHELFAEGKSDFIKYFEDKYKIKMSDYRSGTDDYYFYFNCTPGEEKQKIKEVAKDKIVKFVDYVDVREIEGKEQLEEITKDLSEILDYYGEENLEITKDRIEDIIKRLKKLL